MFYPLLTGVLAALVTSGYWVFGKDRHPDAFGLGIGLLLLFAASNAMLVLFPLAMWSPIAVDYKIATPWAWSILPPAHLMLLVSAYHAAKQGRRWAVAFMTIALCVLLADAWFFTPWIPAWLEGVPILYTDEVRGRFVVYIDVRNWGILAELVLVAIPGGIDGATALYRRRRMGMSRHRGLRV